MLEFTVARPPADLDTALALALDHECVAPCTLMLPGIPLRHYAEGLIGHPIWFLHQAKNAKSEGRQEFPLCPVRF